MKITKAIIPVAGWGTRRLPIAKTIEKCMLPIGNRPLIDYVFVRNGLKVLRYGVLAETEDNAFLSDHAPILVTVE